MGNQTIGSENAEAFPLVEQGVAGLGEQTGWQDLLADLDDLLGSPHGTSRRVRKPHEARDAQK